MEGRSDRFTAVEDQYAGYTVYDPDGDKIGKVDDLFLDENDQPEYLGVKIGFLGTKSTLIPWEMVEVREADSSLIVSADDGHVKDGPTFDDDREITPEFESEVYSYYGLQQTGSTEDRGTYADYSSETTGSGSAGPGMAMGDTESGEFREHPPSEEGVSGEGSDLDDRNELRVQRTEEQLAAGTVGTHDKGTTAVTADVEDKPQVGTKFMHAQLWAEDVEKRAPFHPVDHEGPVEMPDEAYPFQLTTGRRLAFYNTGTMTRDYKKVKDAEELLEITEEDAGKLGVEDGEMVKVSSRRGTINVKARVTDKVSPGLVFLGYHFPEDAPVNQLTINAVDPRSGTAEFKACAVKIEPVV